MLKEENDMGYIIPFTHHTYHNYQHRMQKTKEGPHYIQQSYKAVFHKVRDDYEEQGEEKQFFQSYKSKRNKKEKVKQKRKEITEHERASLVGKGEYFHEKV